MSWLKRLNPQRKKSESSLVTFPYMPKSEIVPVQNGASEDCTLGGL